MTPAELELRLGRGEIVPLTAAQWDALAALYERLDEHDTGMSKAILVARRKDVVVVEEPARGARVVRPFPSLEAARAFVGERLATYDRMWNGCGCKIDYYR